jgi:D-alanine-D-alanine ligase
MDDDIIQTSIPVIVLYNLNPTWSEEDKQDCLTSTHRLSTALASIGHPVQELCLQSAELETLLRCYNPNNYVVFNWCEELPGINHSEYQVVQILEGMGFIYTGSDSRALFIGQDKRWVKRILERFRIPIPEWRIYSATRRLNWSRFPAIVKLAYEHSSYGITRESVVLTLDELQQRVHYVINELHQPALVEEFIDGREFHNRSHRE